MANKTKFRRVLLKLSGEALLGDGQCGMDPDTVARIAQDIGKVHGTGVEVCVVIGGGNIFRGVSEAARNIERASADYMGMLATVINSLAMQSAMEEVGLSTRVLSAIPMSAVCEPYIRRRALRHLAKDRVVIFAAGTGNPYFTTDTAGALRAMEIDANILIKATKVDGVYDSDPAISAEAKKFDKLTYIDAINRRLKVMDSTALSLCMDNDMPILVLDLWGENSLLKAARGESVGTLVRQ